MAISSSKDPGEGSPLISQPHGSSPQRSAGKGTALPFSFDFDAMCSPRGTCDAWAGAPVPDIDMIQIKAKDGSTRSVPLYKAGMDVHYQNTVRGTTQMARILKVHRDDVEPYYSIRLADDGREKQTDNDHIRLTLDDDEKEEDGTAETALEEEDEDGTAETALDDISIITEKMEDGLNVVNEIKEGKDEMAEEPGEEVVKPVCCIDCLGC